MASSKYHGQYSHLYHQLPWARVLVSSLHVQKRLCAEGVDARFISKGYDQQFFANQQDVRDIEAAFLGSLKGHSYSERSDMIAAIAAGSSLYIGRTETREEYLGLLNRIRIFISADVGMGEYMIKNFEAMACGCVLLAWSQGEEEDSALGFEDGKNVMLYRSVKEAIEKIDRLKANPELAERIARAGQAFVEQHYTFARVGRDLARAIEQPMRPWPGVSVRQRMWVRLRYGLKV
jgi:spore maturation protein CgeB